ncbi:MAG: hypothetical protein EBU97_02910, partial [Rhodobacteraceae bacterium]|nr:hypothetical protein [Paracoccaceae bacterium]
GRIFNADGSASTDEFRIGATAIDGDNSFDTDSLVIRQLANGNVVVGYVETGATNSDEQPNFSIIDPSKAPGSPGFAVASDVRINNLSTGNSLENGPPVIETLANGNFVAVWVDGNNALSNELKYRIYDPSGNPLTREISVTQANGSGVSGLDGFDWGNVSVTTSGNGFVISWVGANDGNGTGVFTTGYLDATSGATAPIAPIWIAAVDGTAAADTIGTGYVDADGNAVDGADGIHDLIYGGAGNDTITAGLGADTVYGDAGDDRFVTAAIFTSSGYRHYGGPTSVALDPVQVNTAITGNQSPPKTVVLNDGRVLHIWSDDGLNDDSKSLQLQGRILNANGLPATGQFALGSWAIDGSDGYDVDNLDVDVLANGNVVVSYIRSSQESGFGTDTPVATILNPSVAPGSAGFIVAKNLVMHQTDVLNVESPPVTTVLADGRYFAVWIRNDLSDDTTTMKLGARFFNADGTPASAEMQVGTWAAEGYDGYDAAHLSVRQLAGGNIVVAYIRNTAENGGDEPVFTILSSTGAVVRADVEMQQFDTTNAESPPAITALADGRFMAVWVKDGPTDGTSMTLQGRIFNADGSAATNEFRLGAQSVDGNDAYDTDNYTITQLSDGRVVVGFVEQGAIEGAELPKFCIIDPSKAPGAAGFAVASDVQINTSATTSFLGAAVIKALPNAQFVAVWADDLGTPATLRFRIFDSTGKALSNEIRLNRPDGAGEAGYDSFDWDNFNIVTHSDGTFTVSWVGA